MVYKSRVLTTTNYETTNSECTKTANAFTLHLSPGCFLEVKRRHLLRSLDPTTNSDSILISKPVKLKKKIKIC